MSVRGDTATVIANSGLVALRTGSYESNDKRLTYSVAAARSRRFRNCLSLNKILQKRIGRDAAGTALALPLSRTSSPSSARFGIRASVSVFTDVVVTLVHSFERQEKSARKFRPYSDEQERRYE